MMVRRKRQFIGFGFDPGESAHHFAVIVPERAEDPVTIEERFEWNDELDAVADAVRPSLVKVRLDRYRWGRIAEAARGQFNKNIRSGGHRSVSWKMDQPNILPPHFGKELTLLAWAVEDMDESLIPNVIANWTGLEPEERWWLYTTVNATFTKSDVGKDRGWRKAIKIAFSENPIPEIPGERFVEEPDPIRLPLGEDAPEAGSAGDGRHDMELRRNSSRLPTAPAGQAGVPRSSPAPKKKKRVLGSIKKQSTLFDESWGR